MREALFLFILFLANISSSSVYAQQACPAGEHWDSSMHMCMPNKCPAGEHWDSGMNMCMPNTSNNSLHIHTNAFLVGSSTSGPQGRNAIYSPNMGMIEYKLKLSEKSTFGADAMLSTEKWTLPKTGSPQVLQTGEATQDGTLYNNAQHPHPAVMGVGVSYSRTVGMSDDNKITLFFDPRGEATAGPPAFMHRKSSESNPNVPLGHHVGQDVFHITSTVAGAKYEDQKTTVAASVFSGKEPIPTSLAIDMHKPDSYGILVSRFITPEIQAGTSFANVLSAHQDAIQIQEGAEKENAFSAWVSTKHQIKNGTLNTASIFGMVSNRTTHTNLKSFLEEFSYELEKNNFFGRIEVLQRTPEQLQIAVTDNLTGARWVQALTVGYERKIAQTNDTRIYAGGSYTKSIVPSEFKSTYGGNPDQVELHLRVNLMK